MDVARASTSSYESLLQTELRRAEGKAAAQIEIAAAAESDPESPSDASERDEEDTKPRKTKGHKRKADDDAELDKIKIPTTFVKPLELFPQSSSAFVW